MRLDRPVTVLPRLACLCLLGGISLVALAAPADKSAELMAAYIYNFARFVEWPATQFASPAAPLVLCSTQAAALDGQLQRIHGRQAQNRPVTLRELPEGDDLAGCHILYVARDNHRQAWLDASAGKPILTVSDQPAFAAHGGMIGLFVAADRVQFEINRDAAQSAGLRVSSRLLALARTPGGGR